MIDVERIRREKGDRCWDDVGVFGSGVCEILDEYDHCKNCPVYTVGGRRLLEREIPPELIREWTTNVSLPKVTETADKNSIVVFRIADEWMGLNTDVFQEAVVNKFVHYLPGRSNEYLHGIVNVNGELLICISLARFLNLNNVNYMKNGSRKQFKNLLIIFDKHYRYAFPADEFYGVLSVTQDEMTDPPLTVSKAESTVTSRIFNYRSRTISTIDESKLFALFDRRLIW